LRRSACKPEICKGTGVIWLVGFRVLPLAFGVLLLVVACKGGKDATTPTSTALTLLSPTATAMVPPAATETPTATSAESPTQTPVPPTATAGPDRTSCDEIRGTPYRSESERRWYLDNCVPPTATQPAATVPTTPAATQAPLPQPNVRYLFRLVNGGMVADLAETWEFRDGNSVIAFKLAAGVTLANGQLLDSTAMKQILDARRAQLAASGYIDTSVLDPRTIFVMLQPAALDSVLQALAAIGIAVQPP
jgi:hypothetical protein